ncbi:MAG: hypothetical protein A2Y78_03470 [Acidobacteria bacterium RBG_13_68_16]|nr:MAG: hypothetical protein A2Y78_03470 [Acidobacteria bacterium RBG_13_68_16]
MQRLVITIGVALLLAVSTGVPAAQQPLGGVGSPAVTSTPANAAGPRIVIEPNVLVSKDGDTSHAELYVAAHPTDPKKLIGMGTVFRDVGGKVTNEIYATTDGGQTWTGFNPPQQLNNNSGDPWVGYSRRGTALAVALLPAERLWMWVYRSEDGGMTWEDGVRAGWCDHDHLGVDLGTGPFAGRMYVGGEVSCHTPHTGRCSEVALWRSDDDGRNWIGPVYVGKSDTTGLNVKAINVLTDGTVAVHMTKYPAPDKDTTTPHWEHFLAASNDGGVTFGPMRSLGLQYFGGYGTFRRLQAKVTVGQAWGYDAAVDLGSARYRDRMYRVFSQSQGPNGEGRIFFSYSTDRGQTWTPPVEIAPERRQEVSQFQQAIAVNKDGTVGIMWLDTREAPGKDRWDVYFTASVDGGESFLSARRVTSEVSTPFAARNIRPVPISVVSTDKGVNAMLYSGFSGFPDGGDYLGMAADADGVFHPFWADARSGIYQIMTSRIRVETGETTETAPTSGRPEGERLSLAGKMTLEFDPTRVDWEHGELLIPVRLKNISQDTLYGPFVVELRSVETQSDDKASGAVTKVLNASNGKEGKGARFDYGGALRDLASFAPGGVSEAVMWRVRPALLRNTNVTFDADITGFLPAKELKGGS